MKSLLRNLKLILPCLSIVALLVLMILPQTGWLVRSQIAMTFWSAHALDRDQNLMGVDRDEVKGAEGESLLEDAAKSLPNDLQIQIADAVNTRLDGYTEGEINLGNMVPDICYLNLMMLRRQFPNNASLDANLLRYACANEIETCRDDWKKLDPELPPKAVEQKGLPPPRLRLKEQVQPAPPRLKRTVSKAHADEFDSIVVEGERLEPQNAYFPMMRAALAFDTYHDDLGLAELHKAALSRFWNDHVEDEVIGELRLRELAFGDRSALGRSTEDTELSEQRLIVLLTYTATLLAMQSEMHGQIARGIAIRHDLLSTLNIMRRDAKNISLTSTALRMSQIALQRPGGLPYQHYRHPAWVNNPELLDSQENFRRYRAFLQNHQFLQEVRWLHADEAALEETLSVIDNTNPLIYHDYRDLDWLKLLWGVGLLLFSNTIWLILFGGIALLISQLPHFRERNPMSFGAGWGLLLFAAVWGCIYALIVLKFMYDPGTSQEFATFARILLAIAILLVLAIRQRWSKLRDSLWTLLSITSFMALFFWQSRFFREYLDVIDPEWIGDSAFDGPSEQECLRASLVAILPLLLCLILAVASLVRRIPITVGIVYGLKRFALPCAGFLLLVYCSVAIETAHREKNVADRDAAIQLVGERQYYAAKMGQKWPGDTSPRHRNGDPLLRKGEG